MLQLRTLAPLLTLTLAGTALAQQKVHYTYLWHMEQPIYWPDQQASGTDRYELVWQSIQRKDAGATNPTNNLREIFSLPDRVAGYQYRMIDAVDDFDWTPEGGTQISFSGGLIENLNSLGAANQLGYNPTWWQRIRDGRTWRTSPAAGTQVPRVDVVQFGFHHPLMPLVDATTLRKELQLYRRIYNDTWGTGASQSRGLFPSEMAFSTAMIEVLDQEGIDWVIVSSEKISRACSDFPVIFGSGGINTDAPNRADQINPAAGSYFRKSISRGCSPAEAVPFATTPRRARYVNPNTGAVSQVIVVPAMQALSWDDGYAPIGLGGFDAIQSLAPNGIAPNRPQLALLAHDGDNAWGGGYSYYREATPNLASSANGAQYVPTVVEKYLADHPVPANDFVHVEDGAWVNADGDFGAPQFINWNWPLLGASGAIDVENGWHVDARNWAVITAANNRVATAEQIVTRAGGPQSAGLDVGRILYPSAATTSAERAWHFFLGSLNSGYMYYGTAEDFEVKPTIACNEAVQHADAVITGNTTLDTTGPTVWYPQRHPWNPGSVNFGPQYGYQQRAANLNGGGDFYVWTFAYDVAGITSTTLKYRIDADGQRNLSNIENETYAGGPGVGAWQSISMTRRIFPAGNVYNDPSINFFESPTYIADQYWAKIDGQRSKLIDYYIESVDTRGNVTKSPIQHVWVGDGVGSGGGGSNPAVTIAPTQPVAGQQLTITYNPAGRPLAGSSTICFHWGINTWTNVVSGVPMTPNGTTWSTTITIPQNATSLEFAFNNCVTTWDNNAGADWRYTVTGGQPIVQWTIDGARDTASTLVSSNGGVNLWAGLRGDMLYVATNPASGNNDRFLYVSRDPAGTLRAANWAKAGQIASWDAFLANESGNNFSGWFDQGTTSQTQQASSTTGVLEGVINIRSELGLAANAPLPEFVRLAVGTYATADNGALVTTQQVPAPLASNGSIEASEYALVRLCEIAVPANCPQPACDSIDFNNNGIFPEDQDVTDLFSVLAGGMCATCSDIDFNNNGVFPEDQDVVDYFNVLAGGQCP